MRRSILCLTAIVALISTIAVPAFAQNYALDFDGVDDFVEVSDPININGPLTLEAWIFVRTTLAGRIVSNRVGPDGYDMDVGDVGSEIQLRLGLNGGLAGSAPFDAHMNQWTHVAATWAGTTTMDVNLYINGAQAGSGSWVGDIVASPGPLRIGTMGGANWPFDGLIDEVRVWSVALDENTIRDWMGRMVTVSHPSFANLEGYWLFDEGSGQAAACETGDAARDGQLGSTAGVDVFDPTWELSGVVPVRAVSIGALKERYQE